MRAQADVNDANNVELKTQAEESDNKNAELEQRLAALEAGFVSNKKARTTVNILTNHKENIFGWKKMRRGVSDGNVGFATVQEALDDMARFYASAAVGKGISSETLQTDGRVSNSHSTCMPTTNSINNKAALHVIASICACTLLV